MADIHIERTHDLGLPEARKIAFKWAEQVEAKFDMECTYEEGKTKDSFVLNAKLGFLLGAFKDKIEGEITKNLDALLKKKPAAKKKA